MYKIISVTLTMILSSQFEKFAFTTIHFLNFCFSVTIILLGVLGFSQGACLLSILCALREQGMFWHHN